MKLLRHPLLRYLLLLPILTMIFLSAEFQQASKDTMAALVQEKLNDTAAFVDILTAMVDTNEAAGGHSEEIIVAGVEYVDAFYQIFAAAYRQEGEELVLITAREYETSPLDPMQYEAFRGAIRKQSGSLILSFKPERQEAMDFHLYFRWIPTRADAAQRYLVAVGVTEKSVTTRIGERFSAPLWISLAVTVGLNILQVIQLTSREEPDEDA